MIIPTKIIFNGDRSRCQSVLGIARKRLNVFEDRLNRGNGMIQQGWQNSIQLITGEIIRLAVSFNTSIIEITAPPPPGGLEVIKKPEERECFCCCNFAMGFVTKLGTLIEGIQPYDVTVCNLEKFYTMYENILASDFTKYVPGQGVIVMAYNAFQYLCCSETLQNPTSCTPQISTLELANDAWRCTYRIVPLCSLSIPMWVSNG